MSATRKEVTFAGHLAEKIGPLGWRISFAGGIRRMATVTETRMLEQMLALKERLEVVETVRSVYLGLVRPVGQAHE